MVKIYSDAEYIKIADVEKKLLASLLNSRTSRDEQLVATIAGVLRASDFYRPEHRIIYATLERLIARGVPIGFEVVKTELYQTGGFGRMDVSYYNGLKEQEYTAKRAPYYASIVQKKALQRALMEAGREIADMASRDELTSEQMEDFAEKKILKARMRVSAETPQKLSEILQVSLDGILKRQAGLEKGIASGFMDMDKVLSGFQASDLIILAARPSVGKTALALNMAINAVRTSKTVILFSLEMSKPQIGNRLLSLWSGVNGQYLNSGNLQAADMDKLLDAASELERFNLYIDDTAGIGLLEMRTKARRLQHDVGLDMIIIDYLQLMQGSRAENRQQEISEISRGLKALARELKVPVIALSQLSRSVEMRAEKKPQLSDLRESGSLEQDADIVMFLYRDEYYNRDDPTNENIAEVIIAKNRNGPTTALRLHFEKTIMKFSNLTREVGSS